MNVRAFENYLTAIQNAIDAGYNRHERTSEKTFEQHGRWALRRLETLFCDRKQNIRRYLSGNPCVFVSSRTGKHVEVDIGQNVKELYSFLIFCKKLNANQDIDKSFCADSVPAITESRDKWERY